MSRLKKNILYIASIIIPLLLSVALIYWMNRVASADLVFSNINKITSSVINQALFIFALEVFGLLVMMCFNKYLSKLQIIMLSFIIGVLFWCLASVVIVCIGIIFTWYWVAFVCVLFLGILCFILRPKKPVIDDVIFYLKTLLIYVSISMFFAALCVFRFSYDSYMYINTGMKIAKLGYISKELIEIVSGFSLFTPMLFSPAIFFNYDFSQGLYLLLNVQFTLLIGYVVYENLSNKTTTKIAIISGTVAVLALVSSNIYFELIYWPMSNLLTAMTLFGLVYFSYQSQKQSARANMILSAIFGMCFVLTRSENMLLYICIMFIVSLSDVKKKHLVWHLASVAFVLALWYVRFFAVAGISFSEGAFLTFERAVQLLGILLIFILYVVILGKSKILTDKKKYLEVLFFGAMAVAIIILGVLNPESFIINLKSTLVNMFYDGSWAGALLIIPSLYLIKSAYQKKIDFYDKTIFIFILFHAIIFLLRDMPLRIGFGDSGSRYFAHILPIMIYTIAVSLGKKLIHK